MVRVSVQACAQQARGQSPVLEQYVLSYIHFRSIPLRPIAFFFIVVACHFFNLKNEIPWYYTFHWENCMRRAAEQLYDFVVWHCAKPYDISPNDYRRSQLETPPKPICYKFLIVECRVATLAQIRIWKMIDSGAGKWQGLLFVRIIKLKKKKTNERCSTTHSSTAFSNI